MPAFWAPPARVTPPSCPNHRAASQPRWAAWRPDQTAARSTISRHRQRRPCPISQRSLQPGCRRSRHVPLSWFLPSASLPRRGSRPPAPPSRHNTSFTPACEISLPSLRQRCATAITAAFWHNILMRGARVCVAMPPRRGHGIGPANLMACGRLADLRGPPPRKDNVRNRSPFFNWP